MTYISIKNQSKLLGLPREDIVEMMLSGICFLDASITSYVSQIQGLPQEVMFDDESLKKLTQQIHMDDFNITQVGSLIKIESNKQTPSLFFLKNNWYETLNEESQVNQNMYALIPHRSKGPMFIGEEEAIFRLSDSFDGDYDIIGLEEIKKG